MKHFFIVFILYSTAIISFSSGEEVHAEEPSEKSVKSSYTYSIEYSDAGNHGKYGHKIQVTDGNAKVNVHAEHPQVEEQVKQQKIRSQHKPNHVKQQVLAYVPTQEIPQTVVPHHKEQHSSPQHVQVQKAPSSGKLPIETLDKQQLAILLAQNRNPFLPLTEHKDSKSTQLQKPGVTKNTLPDNKHIISYYVPQGHSQYQVPTQSSKDASAYTDPQIQYTYQYQPSPAKNNLVYDSKVQYASAPNQQQYYYPETNHLYNNQMYQNYYQHQTPATPHSTTTAQQQVQYTVPITQHHQQQPQQYVYVPQTVPQTSGGHAQQFAYSQLQVNGQHGGPVQFLPPHQSQNSHTYPTTNLYNIPKVVNVPAGAPELSAYPPSLFSNVQYGSSIYGSTNAYGAQANIGYKPVVEAPQTGKTNQYETISPAHGINYGTRGSQNFINENQSGLYKPNDASISIQDTKSSNFYATATNLPQGVPASHGNLENFAQAYHLQGTASNVAYKQPTSGTPAAQHSIDYSQLGQNTKQIQYPLHYSNEINNVKQQTTYVPTNFKTNVPFIPSKQIASYEPGSTPVKVQKNHYAGAIAPQHNLPQYYYPSPAVKHAEHAENNVRYVYVQANGIPLSEQSKVPEQ